MILGLQGRSYNPRPSALELEDKDDMGLRLWRALKVTMRILKVIRWGTGIQWSCCRTSVMGRGGGWEVEGVCFTAEFWSSWSLRIVLWGTSDGTGVAVVQTGGDETVRGGLSSIASIHTFSEPVFSLMGSLTRPLLAQAKAGYALDRFPVWQRATWSHTHKQTHSQQRTI